MEQLKINLSIHWKQMMEFSELSLESNLNVTNFNM